MKKITSWPGIFAFNEENKDKFKFVKEDLNGKEVEILYRKGNPGVTKEEADEIRAAGGVVDMFSICPHLKTCTYDAGDGIICERDIAVAMRDGTTIYVDIYRPKTDEKIPVIVSWGPFGKRPSEGMDEWKLMGVPPKAVSTMAKFESADPGFWCHQGYAVANCDPRGVGNSEGDVSVFGLQDGRDGADFIDWVAEQEWCNGKVGMFGNSGVGMVQWRIAAEQPKHLECIAVWEGTGDHYRESLMVGGVPQPIFNEGIVSSVAAKNYVEDGGNMLILHPFMDEYWESKIPRWKNIKIPTYVCGGWCHIHLRGSLEGFRRIRSRRKWLRIHRDMEWPDTYSPDNLMELKRFYDRYLKNIRNGWEFTPRVRHDLMDAYGFDYISNKEENEWPIARTEYKKLYLDVANNALCEEETAEEKEFSYDPKSEEPVVFEYTFKEDTELTGYFKLHLNVECRGYDNMDLFFWIKKFKANGEYVPVECMKEPYRGAWGYYRATRRELDPELSTDFQPVQAHKKDELMEEGQIYPCDIEIWPHSRIWHKGEKLRLEVTGHFIRSDWFIDGHLGFQEDNGDGIHVLHTGGQYQSYLQVPVIPPKYTSGDLMIR